MSTIKRSLYEKFNGIIWKVETDASSPVIAIETRDPDNKTSHFSAFNFSDGTCLFRDLTIEDSWNWGLDAVHENVTLLHGYASATSPEHKGIIALGTGGEVLWQHFNKTLHALAPEGVITYNPSVQPRSFELLSPQTGMPVKNHVDHFDYLERRIIIPEEIESETIPLQVRPDDLYGPVNFATFHNRNIYSFHIRHNHTFTQKLVIMEEDQLILEDFLERDIQKLQPEAFFIQHNHLFCIRNKKQEIVAYLV